MSRSRWIRALVSCVVVVAPMLAIPERAVAEPPRRQAASPWVLAGEWLRWSAWLGGFGSLRLQAVSPGAGAPAALAIVARKAAGVSGSVPAGSPGGGSGSGPSGNSAWTIDPNGGH